MATVFIPPHPTLPQGRGLLRDRALPLTLSKGLGEGSLKLTCFIHQTNIDLPLVKSVGSRILAQAINSTAFQKNTHLTEWVKLRFF